MHELWHVRMESEVGQGHAASFKAPSAKACALQHQQRHAHTGRGVCASAGRHLHRPTLGNISQTCALKAGDIGQR
ncbi:hypothetical protein EJD97_013288 [Solanum chilense]|uniref:Uncharacterized protein n=1 Tax=Solanum chilense TaxID=4083 RepID=A0A6N2CHG1_SOLCI|nr:hypothetical protein EJD97_013288 [Solanum chilense]